MPVIRLDTHIESQVIKDVPLMHNSSSTIDGSFGAVSDAGKKISSKTNLIMKGAPLGRYVIIYAAMSWVLAAIPIIIYMLTELTPTG